MRDFTVQGMTCGHCERAVKEAIAAQDPSAIVSVELASGKVAVDSRLSDAQVQGLIEQEGFTVVSPGN